MKRIALAVTLMVTIFCLAGCRNTAVIPTTAPTEKHESTTMPNMVPETNIPDPSIDHSMSSVPTENGTTSGTSAK